MDVPGAEIPRSTSSDARPGARTIAWTLQREVVLLCAWGPAILLQLAHPLVACGVADHSVFRAERWGRTRRFHRTLEAMLRLSFGTEREASLGVARVNAIHDRVHGELDEPAGVFPAGTAYSAHDPGRHEPPGLRAVRGRAASRRQGPLLPRGQRDRAALRHPGRAAAAERRRARAVHGHDARERGDQCDRDRADAGAGDPLSGGASARGAGDRAHAPDDHRALAAADPGWLRLPLGGAAGGHAPPVGRARPRVAATHAVRAPPLAGGACRRQGGERLQLSGHDARASLSQACRASVTARTTRAMPTSRPGPALWHDSHVVAEEARTELPERSALADEGVAEPLGLEGQKREQVAKHSGAGARIRHLVGVEQVDQAPVA